MKKFFSALLIMMMLMSIAVAEADLPAVMGGFGLDDEMMELEESDLLDIYGIDPADVKQFAAAINSTGIKCDEIVLIETVDGAADRVKTALDNRYQTKLNETDGYLPEENAIIKTCEVTVNGNYVAMIVSANAAEYTQQYTAAIQ